MRDPLIPQRLPPRRRRPAAAVLVAAVLVAVGAFAAAATPSLADPAASGAWLVFLAQQSLRSRDNALVALGILGLAGGAAVAVTLLASALMARGPGLDPGENGRP